MSSPEEYDYRGAATGRLRSKDFPVTLSDGTDISRMTVDQIAVAQRKLSPKFPPIADALERRQRFREAFVARAQLLTGAAGLIYSHWDSFGYVIAGFGFVGFVITCFVAGNRQYVRSGGGR